MKLLICTQVVDSQDPILGFFHRWIEEFAKHCEEVHVICLRSGTYSLPENVSVYSLGKENGGGRLLYILQFYKQAWSLRKKYDSVFVHMNPEYVVLMGLPWRLLGKKIALWYSHKSVTLWLWLANLLAHHIFSTTSHAMRIKSRKVSFVGHGIDLTRFNLLPIPTAPVRILYVGRVTPIKRIDLMLETFLEMANRGHEMFFDIVGDIGSKRDKSYQEQLLAMIPENLKSRVIFHGSVPQSELNHFLSNTHVFYNFSPSGGMDKAVLEAMACGVAPVVTNEAFKEVLNSYPDLCLSDQASIEKLVGATEKAIVLAKVEASRNKLRTAIASQASVENLVTVMLRALRL
jgi:glycosyltransferase involved in cell wall biosynthesis